MEQIIKRNGRRHKTDLITEFIKRAQWNSGSSVRIGEIMSSCKNEHAVGYLVGLLGRCEHDHLGYYPPISQSKLWMAFLVN